MKIFLSREDEQRKILEAVHDPRAFGDLFDAYYDSILRYCLYHTGNVETARDITAETFYKALKNLWRFKCTGTFSSWLYRIASNEVIDFFRKKKHRCTSLSDAMEQQELLPLELRRNLQDEMDDLQQRLEDNRKYQRIRQMMEKLPVQYRTVLVLRFIEEKKISEIGEILGKKEGTVKSLISRGMTLLREKAEKCTVHTNDIELLSNHSVPEGELF
jgi:RNA polymerase sigma-70 factor (ECF subfamily)